MEDKYNCLKLDNQICFPLYACAKEVVRAYKPYLDELDLTYTQYITMMVLWEERSINVRDIGRRLYLDSGTLTPLLKKLEKKGYIVRKRSAEDERNLIVELTDEGFMLRERALKVPKQMGECICLDDKELADIYDKLYIILDRLSSKNRAVK